MDKDQSRTAHIDLKEADTDTKNKDTNKIDHINGSLTLETLLRKIQTFRKNGLTK